MQVDAAFIGTLVGSLIGMFILSVVIEWTIVRLVCDDPVWGKVGSVAAAFFVACMLGLLDDHLSTAVLAAYGISAVVVGVVQYRGGVRLRAGQRHIPSPRA